MDAKGLGKRKMQLRGGKRKNAGRKSAYDEPTKNCQLSLSVVKNRRTKIICYS